MPNKPGGANVTCPACNAKAVAIIPQGSTIVEEEEAADGKVWVSCYNCENLFPVYYQEKPIDEGG